MKKTGDSKSEEDSGRSGVLGLGAVIAKMTFVPLLGLVVVGFVVGFSGLDPRADFSGWLALAAYLSGTPSCLRAPLGFRGRWVLLALYLVFLGAASPAVALVFVCGSTGDCL